MGLFRKKPEHAPEKRWGLGYKTDGRGTREKVGKGKQRMLLDSTKLLLDNAVDSNKNPYEAEKRVDNNIHELFKDDN